MVESVQAASTLPDAELLGGALRAALRTGGDFAEVFVEDRRSSRATFDDGKVEELVSGRLCGAGIRVRSGASVGFAHTADLTPEGLRAAAETAAAAARAGGSQRPSGPLTHQVAAAPNAVWPTWQLSGNGPRSVRSARHKAFRNVARSMPR